MIEVKGPVEFSDGTKLWYKNGIKHREDGPAKEYANGTKVWYKNGVLHREDGPAIEYFDGSKHWYKNGVRHREDGPATEHADGTVGYWLFHLEYSYEEWLEKRFWSRLSSEVVK